MKRTSLLAVIVTGFALFTVPRPVPAQDFTNLVAGYVPGLSGRARVARGVRRNGLARRTKPGDRPSSNAPPWRRRSVCVHSTRRSRVQPRDLPERQDVDEYRHGTLDPDDCAVAEPHAQLMVPGGRQERPQFDRRTPRRNEQSHEGTVAVRSRGGCQTNVRSGEPPGHEQAVDVRRVWRERHRSLRSRRQANARRSRPGSSDY